MKSFTVFVLLVCFSALLVADPGGAAGSFSTADPETLGLSAERLARATQAIEEDVAAGRIAGAIGLVARRGKIAYFEVRGQADRERQRPMKKDTILRIYSMTKPIVSAALMMLHEEGKFMLTDPVARYLPQYKDMEVMVDAPTWPGDPKRASRVPARREITVQDLMRHTAGMTYGLFGGTSVDKLYTGVTVLDKTGTLDDMSRKLGKLPLVFHPGEKWHYSVAVDVQGHLIEMLSGMPLDRFLEERIFKPLGMVDTGFHVPKAKLDRLAQLYAPTEEPNKKLRVADASVSEWFVKPGTFFSGGGGLLSTTGDYVRFAQMMLNGGELNGVRLLGRKTVELMTTDHTDGIDMSLTLRPGWGFGLGVAVHEDPGTSGSAVSVGTFSWGGAAGTRVWMDPVEDLVVIYMVQIRPHTDLRYGKMFSQYVYQAIVD